MKQPPETFFNCLRILKIVGALDISNSTEPLANHFKLIFITLSHTNKDDNMRIISDNVFK